MYKRLCVRLYSVHCTVPRFFLAIPLSWKTCYTTANRLFQNRRINLCGPNLVLSALLCTIFRKKEESRYLFGHVHTRSMDIYTKDDRARSTVWTNCSEYFQQLHVNRPKLLQHNYAHTGKSHIRRKVPRFSLNICIASVLLTSICYMHHHVGLRIAYIHAIM